LRRFKISEKFRTAKYLNFPRLARDTGPPSKAGFVFVGDYLIVAVFPFT